MLSADDLRQVVAEIVGEVCAKRGLSEQPSNKDGEWLTRDELCARLHITPTTLWRLEKAGKISKRKLGRRNLYLKDEVDALVSAEMGADDNKKGGW